MNRYVTAFALFCAFSAAAQAQNYNPTVVVTNKYMAATENARKGGVEMAVPDSVRRFDMTFDYSVFDKPYRGAYEFSPYSVKMKPSSGSRSQGWFYMDAGLGYTLHPELDLVYTPVSNGRLSLDIYGSHRSFAGDYRKVGLDGRQRLTGLKSDGKRQYWGDWNYDMDNDAGLSLRYDWPRVGMTADLAYEGLQQRDWLRSRSLDKGVSGLRVFSKDTVGGGVKFEAWMKYRLAHDCMSPKYGVPLDGSGPDRSGLSLGEHSFATGAVIDIYTRKKGRIFVDVNADVASYMNAEVPLYMNPLTHTAAVLELAPGYRLNVRGWSFDLGLKIDIPFVSDDAGAENAANSQYVYPALKISYDFTRLPLGLRFEVEGGERMNSYSSTVGEYRHYGMACSGLSSHPVLANTVERVKATFALDGRIRSVFGYGAFISYSERASSALESVRMADLVLGDVGQLPVYDLSYASSGLLCAGADAHYSDDWGRVDFGLRYNGLFVRDDTLEYIAPAALTGDLSVSFNIMKRFFAGVGCEFSTARRGRIADGSGTLTDYSIPAFGEPYFSAEFRYSRSLSFWLKGCRLTGQTIQRTPLYAERGPEITAGVRLSFGK